MAEDWVDERDRAILETIYYCENCNMVLEPGDTDIERHKKELPHHKMRKVFIVRCGNCGNTVTDSHAQYSPERNQFWCKNCIAETGVRRFYTAEHFLYTLPGQMDSVQPRCLFEYRPCKKTDTC